MNGASSIARLVRSSATSAVVLTLAAGAHIMGGGSLPAPMIVAALGTATLLAVTVIANKAPALPALLAILGLRQWILHHAFSLTTAAACVAALSRHGASQAISCLSPGVQGSHAPHPAIAA